ncbi:MAG: glycosyltransferase, partial [Candidatus Heimdallarchaeota archaeon]
IDDGSTDKTSQIAKKAAEKAKLNFEIINRKDRGFAALGLATLANVYNDGFNAVNLKDFDFMVVNGADALMESNYFEMMLEYFDLEPKLVIASGKCPGEGINVRHVHGSAGRFYRMDFFRIACKGRYEISYAWESLPILDSIFILRGAAMREVGYWFPYAMGRCLLTAYRRKRLKAGLLMFIGFIRGKPSKQRLELTKQYRNYQINLARRVLLKQFR